MDSRPPPPKAADAPAPEVAAQETRIAADTSDLRAFGMTLTKKTYAVPFLLPLSQDDAAVFRSSGLRGIERANALACFAADFPNVDWQIAASFRSQKDVDALLAREGEPLRAPMLLLCGDTLTVVAWPKLHSLIDTQLKTMREEAEVRNKVIAASVREADDPGPEPRELIFFQYDVTDILIRLIGEEDIKQAARRFAHAMHLLRGGDMPPQLSLLIRGYLVINDLPEVHASLRKALRSLRSIGPRQVQIEECTGAYGKGELPEGIASKLSAGTVLTDREFDALRAAGVRMGHTRAVTEGTTWTFRQQVNSVQDGPVMLFDLTVRADVAPDFSTVRLGGHYLFPGQAGKDAKTVPFDTVVPDRRCSVAAVRTHGEGKDARQEVLLLKGTIILTEEVAP